ncbi:MAG: hypothetical protein V3S64_07160 [bacterium]
MQVVGSSTNKQTEPNIRPQNPDLFLRQEAYEREQQAEPVRNPRIAFESPESFPSPYMMLISRIDGMLAKGGMDRRVVDQLQRLITERITGISPAARRNLMELPATQALGVDHAAALPETIARGIDDASRRESVMELLRNPGFAAAMKDEARTNTYGPRGLLRAS